MKNILSANIARYRKEIGFTQDELARHLGITYQAVSKWETEQSMPDIALLPVLSAILHVSIDRLLGYNVNFNDKSCYEDAYSKDEYFWGVKPSHMCLKVLELMPPTTPLKLLDIGCGEGKDAVFFARCGYNVSAFDISDAGLEKLKRLADSAHVSINAFKANILDYRLNCKYDVLFSSGALHYIKPDLRGEIMRNYIEHTNIEGINAFHVFVKKPFINPAPEKEAQSFPWLSGQLFTYYHDWFIEDCTEYVFHCNSSGIPHQHVANKIYARRKQN